MNVSRRWKASLTAATLVAGAAVSGIALASSVQAPAAADTGPVHTVTLVTGDRVTVSGDGGHVSAQAGPGRDGITFDITTAHSRVRVVPNDAGPLLAAGRLDARLFDVTGLVATGYDGKDALPLILTGSQNSAVTGVDGLTKKRDLPAVKGMAVHQARVKAADSWRALTGGARSARTLKSGLGKVWLDGMRRPTLDVSVPQVGAPAAWSAGYTGAGTTVAVLDSGIDATHPDLAGQVVAQRNFTEDAEPDNDLSGHGTHVAATIAGTGAGSGGKLKGMAPGAKLLDGKVCTARECPESGILAGMTWAAADQHAKVVNLSLGGEDDPGVVDPIEEAVQTLSDQYGTLFVIAAGNADGVVDGAISSPGTAEAALTVGAVNDQDVVASFSRRGPTGDSRLKPDITAPGVDIQAARGKDSTQVPGSRGAPYTTLSGTSMATPHVAGAAAILAQQHGDWSGQRLKAALMASAQPNPANRVYAQGAGRLDLARAVTQGAISAPAGISFGKQVWPHQDDQVLSRDVTYHNAGSAGVTLALELSTVNPDGTPTPQGMFTADEVSVVVPAGGDATVTVTVDTRVVGPDGYVGGWLTATGGGSVLRTPVAVHKEVESYDVTLTHLDRDGGTPLGFSTNLFKRDSEAFQTGWRGPDPGNTVTLRVPTGHYTVTSAISTFRGMDSSGGKPIPLTDDTLLAQPDLNVDRSLTVNLDARLGQPISVTVPRSSAQQAYAEVAAYTRRPQGTAGHILLGTSFKTLYSARIGPDSSADDFFSVVAGQWAQSDANGGTDNSPYLYSLFFPENGRMVNGYQRGVADRELAQVRADFGLAQPGTFGRQGVNTGWTGSKVGGFGPSLTFRLPFTRTEYYNTDPGVASAGQFQEWSTEGQISDSESTAYRHYSSTGRPYHEQWNRGVFAPGLSATTSLSGWRGVTRDGDHLRIDVPRFSDGAGHVGDGSTTRSSATLFRNGTKVADLDGTRLRNVDVEVAPEEAAYRLELHTERGSPFVLSTKTDIAWTFRSGHVPATTPTALPLWLIRLSPDVDKFNTVRAGGVRAVPMSITAQPGSAAGKLVSRTVEASFNDGATWKTVRVKDGAAHVPHPGGSGFVSLRVKATDSSGRTVELTIIHAYRYGKTR